MNLTINETPNEREGKMRNLSTVKELTNELNRLRVANGKSPLKVWKESKDKAVDAIKAEVELLKPINKTPEEKVELTIKEKAEKLTGDKVEDITPEEFLANTSEEIPEETPVEVPVLVEETPEPKETFTVVELSIELNISPKVARAKLRRTEDPLPPKIGKGWTFANDVKEALIKILSGSTPKGSIVDD